MKLMIKNIPVTLKLVGWLQIVGGLTGLGLVAYLMLQTGTINGPVLLIFMIGLGLFSYSIYAGKRLLTDQHKITGIVLSIINQVLQIFQWSMFGHGFSYSSGGELTLSIKGLAVNFHFSAIMSTFKMAINSDDEFFFKINLMAILVIAVLTVVLKELTDKKEKVELEKVPTQEVEY